MYEIDEGRACAKDGASAIKRIDVASGNTRVRKCSSSEASYTWAASSASVDARAPLRVVPLDVNSSTVLSGGKHAKRAAANDAAGTAEMSRHVLTAAGRRSNLSQYRRYGSFRSY